MAKYPEFRPAPLADLVSLYARSWNYLRHDFRDDRHLLSLFAFGRGNFSYVNIDREWQQTTGFFGKAQVAHATLVPVLEREKLTSYPSRPALPSVARFEFFRAEGRRVAGVWLVRQGPLRFALPLTTGTRPGVADYLPAPHGLPGFAVPVEQDVPALVPYLELEDGNTIVTTDGADEIHPSADGRELRAVWRRWAKIGAKPGQLVDPGLVSEVTWRIRDGGLTRVETLTAVAPVTIRSWQMTVPSTATAIQPDGTLFSGTGALLRVAVNTPWKADARIRATGDGPLGRGARGYIPLHLTYVARDIRVTPTRPATWQVTLQPLQPSVE